MKKISLIFISLSFLIFSPITLAEKIIITGEPIVIQKQADVYVPANVVATQDYYYFTENDTKRVCYKEANPALASIDAGIFSVKLGDEVVKLHCYDFSADYFVVQ